MNTKLYVGNLPYETTESDLQSLFAGTGQVSSVNVIRDRATGQARGFAFVEMSDAEGARRAIAELDAHLARPVAAVGLSLERTDVVLAGGFVSSARDARRRFLIYRHDGRDAEGFVPVELDLEAWLSLSMPAYREVSRFPAVTRDLALTVEKEQPLAPLLGAFRAAAPAIVQEIRLFDVYQGKGLPEGRKSVAFRIVMQHTERTLGDAEVDAAVSLLVEIAGREFGGALRS